MKNNYVNIYDKGASFEARASENEDPGAFIKFGPFRKKEAELFVKGFVVCEIFAIKQDRKEEEEKSVQAKRDKIMRDHFLMTAKHQLQGPMAAGTELEIKIEAVPIGHTLVIDDSRGPIKPNFMRRRVEAGEVAVLRAELDAEISAEESVELIVTGRRLDWDENK